MSNASGLPQPRARSRSPSREATPAASVVLTAEDRSLLGPAPVTIFENAEQYEELLRRLVAEVAPEGVIELIWVKDVADLTWEVLRLRRAKAVAIAVAQEQALRWVIDVTDAPDGSRVREMSGGARAEVVDYLSAPANGAMYPDQREAAEMMAFAKQPIQRAFAKLGLSEGEIGDAALVQSIGTVERLDRLVLISSRRRDAIIRDLERRRSDLAARLARAVAQATDEAVAS